MPNIDDKIFGKLTKEDKCSVIGLLQMSEKN